MIIGFQNSDSCLLLFFVVVYYDYTEEVGKGKMGF